MSWLIVSGSAIGSYHVLNDIPCQDAHKVAFLKKDWGIAIVSDGAGSAANSDKGSRFIVNEACKSFCYLIKSESWIEKNTFPSEEEWRKKSIETLKTVYLNLIELCKKEDINASSVAATVIIKIFSPKGLLVCHVGDGRAGFLNCGNNWQSSIYPYKGEEVGQTIFLTTKNIWNDKETYIETRVIEEKIKAFLIVSDGCESACFLINQKKENEELYFDPNIPYDKFLNYKIKTIKSQHQLHISVAEINRKFKNFLTNGMEILRLEQDDKTMILGTLI